MNMSKLIISGAVSVILMAGCISTTTGSVPRRANNIDAAEQNYQLGARYYKQGSYLLARDRLELATQLNPKLALAYSALALTYDALDNKRLATKAYEAAVRNAPRDFDIQNAYAVFLCRQREFDRADKYFQKAMKHRENDFAEVTMTNAGVCMVQRPDLDLAESYFRAALERRSNYGEALLQLCLLKFQRQDFLSARAFLQRFMLTNTTTAGILYLGSRIEDELGDDRARADFENRLLSEYPTSPEARKVLSAG